MGVEVEVEVEGQAATHMTEAGQPRMSDQQHRSAPPAPAACVATALQEHRRLARGAL